MIASLAWLACGTHGREVLSPRDHQRPVVSIAPATATRAVATPAIEVPTPAAIEPAPIELDADVEWLAFRSDDALLVALQTVGPEGVLELDVPELCEVWRAPAPEAGPPAAWSPAAQLLAYTSVDGLVLSRRDGAEPDRVLAGTSGETLAFSPDGAQLLVSHSQPGAPASVVVVDIASGSARRTLRPFGTRKLPFDSAFMLRMRIVDADRIALLLANDTPAAATLTLWSSKRGRALWRRDLTGPDEGVFGMAPHLGEALAVGGDATILAGNLDTRVHEFRTGAAPELLHDTGIHQTVTAITIAPDGSWVAVAGDEGPLELYALPDFARLASVPVPSRCSVIAASPDARRLAAGCGRVVMLFELAALRDGSP